MSKNYLMGIIVCVALTMTGCSSDETVGGNSQQGDPIEFGTYLGRDAQARGIITSTETLKKFGVTAYYDEDIPNFMYNQAVTTENPGQNATWTYSPVKYWPTMEGHPILFYAYAPHTDDANGLITLSGNTEKGVPKAKISLPTGENADLTKMVDFVAGVKLYQSKTNGNATSDVVKFNLRHEMTRIGLQATVSENVYRSEDNNKANKTKVVIRSLQLNTGGEFYTKATYQYPMYNETDNAPNRGTWKDKTGTTDLNLQSILNWSADWTINGTSTKVISNDNKGIALEGTSPVNLFKTSDSKQQYLFLIPSTNVDNSGTPTGLKANTTTATIRYDIITEDANLKDGYSITSATKTVYLPAGVMKQGVAYNLLFTIAVDQVKLSATVDNWNTPTADDEVDVPYTPDDATSGVNGTVTETPGGGTSNGPDYNGEDNGSNMN